MIYRYLGKSGLRISVFGYGNWINAAADQLNVIQQAQLLSMRECRKHGINFFDTAERYGFGQGELIFGNCLKELKWDRKDYVITTKIQEIGKGVNHKMLSRKHVIEGVTASLKRLQLDYVDIVYAHRYDQETPIEEVCRAFNWVIEKGWAFYWGTSYWTPQQIMEAMACCDRCHLIKPIVEQPEYNLLVRKNVEVDLVPLFTNYGMGCTSWSPLAGGFLTGKYNKSVPKGSRYDDKIGNVLGQNVGKMYQGKYKFDDIKSTLIEFSEFSKSLGFAPSQVALAWLVKNTDVTSCMLGASKASQITENVKSLELVKKWNKDIESKISEIFKNDPETLVNWRFYDKNPQRRLASVHFNGSEEFMEIS